MGFLYVYVEGSFLVVYDYICLLLFYLIFYFLFLIVYLEENDSMKCVFVGIKLCFIDVNDVNVFVCLMDGVFIMCVFVYIFFIYFFI